jgi:hypothetical protein
MPETLQPPLTNNEIAQHLEHQIDAHNDAHSEQGHYDPSSIGYDPRIALEGTSLVWMQGRTEDPATPDLVQHNETTGTHELSTERLLVDANELERWVGSDLGELRKAIKDPQMARRRVAETLTGQESTGTFASEPLTRQEVHDYINIGIPRPEDESEAAMHDLSIRVVDELVNTWEHEAQMGILHGALDRSGGKVTWGESGIDGQRPLDQHLFGEKDKVLANFHEIHQENVRRLGEDAQDAAGVRLGIAEQVGESGDSANTAERSATQGETLEGRVINADEDTIYDATDSEIEALEAKLGALSPEQRGDGRTERFLNTRIQDMQDVARAVRVWQDEKQGAETFPDFVKRTAESDRDDVDDALALQAASLQIDGGSFFRIVRNELEKPPAVEVASPRPAHEQPVSSPVQETTEQDRNAELFAQITEYAHGRTQLRTDILTGYRAIGDGPDRDESLTDIPRGIIRELEGDKDWHKHPNEAVSFLDTEDGTVQFNYKFKYSVPSYNNGEFNGELPLYTSWAGGRSSQEVALGVNLPKPIADALQDAIRLDPASVRTLVEQLALANNDGSLTREAWEHGNTSKKLPRENPIRPPYEGLPNDWTITMITGPLSSGRPNYTADRLRLAA